MPLLSLMLSGLAQAAVSLVLAGLAWSLYRGWCALRRNSAERFRSWCGLVAPQCPAREIAALALVSGLGGAAAFLAAHALIPGFEPPASIQPGARLPLLASIVAALAYGFLQTGFSEELLFRGVLARQLVRWLGFHPGNTLQALLFAGIHHAMLAGSQRAVSGWLHLYTFLLVFPMAWVGAWYNERRAGGSIAASWAIHGSANFAATLMARAL